MKFRKNSTCRKNNHERKCNLACNLYWLVKSNTICFLLLVKYSVMRYNISYDRIMRRKKNIISLKLYLFPNIEI